MTLLKDSKPLILAAMSEPTVRKYARSGLMPSAVKAAQTWRTGPDPYQEVCAEVQTLLDGTRGLRRR